jgi:hypothetical protein
MKKKKIVFLSYYNLLIKKSIKRISYILMLKNLDYGINNKCYIIIIIIIIFFFWGGGRA